MGAAALILIGLACSGGPDVAPTAVIAPEDVATPLPATPKAPSAAPPPLPLILDADGEILKEHTDAGVIPELLSNRASGIFSDDGWWVWEDIVQGLPVAKCRGDWSVKQKHLLITGECEELDCPGKEKCPPPFEERLSMRNVRLFQHTKDKGNFATYIIGCVEGKGTCTKWAGIGRSTDWLSNPWARFHFGIRILQAGGPRKDVDEVTRATQALLKSVREYDTTTLIEVDHAKNHREGRIEVLYVSTYRDLAMKMVTALEQRGAKVTYRVWEQDKAPVIVAVGADSGLRSKQEETP